MLCRICPCVFVLPVAMAIGAVAGLGLMSQPADKKEKETPPAATPDAYVLDYKLKRIDGTEEDLSIYKGKVVVMVNLASKCGYTPQYAALEALYQELKDKGLVILGFPANNFGGQEPGSNSEIAHFCREKYNVTFPLFEKISVKGEDQHPLYKELTSQPAPIGGDPKWNFTKFVVDQKGNVVARFDAKGDGGDRSRLEPGLAKKIHELLGIKPGKEAEKEPETKKVGSP
jgi:glutathione peroxidase